MTDYCLVENGAVISGPKILPQNWNNVSNLPALSDSDLLDLGWYVCEYPVIVFDPATQLKLSYTLDVQPTKVVVNYEIGDKSAAYLEQELKNITDKNILAAKEKQEDAMNTLAMNTQRQALGLPPDMSDTDEQTLKEFVGEVQAEIDYPSEDEAYNPPLPPGVNPPDVTSLAVKITRVAGWNDVLGWRVVLIAGETNYTPTNLAIAEYTNPDCDGYLYTTGAFQEDEGEYFTICPPGQEKGDIDLNFGLLFGAAPLSCFTLSSGVQEKIIYAYEET